MLLTLHIRNFAIIDELELDLREGMTVLTGETGAGKSILFDALGFLIGDRADAGVVRHGSERSDISATFNIQKLKPVQNWLEENDLGNEDECQLRRVIHREGRSRAYINGSPVPLQSMRSIGEHLVDIHGQHEHQSLMKPGMQRQLLDQYGGLLSLEHERVEIYQQWKKIKTNIEDITGSDSSRDSRVEFLKYQVQELEELSPETNEAAQLHEELSRLSNAGELIATIGSCIELLYEDENSAHNKLGNAINKLEPLTTIDKTLNEASGMINNAVIQLQEGIDLLRENQSSLELDPQRHDWVEQRLDALHNLARKHRIEPEKLTEFHNNLLLELKQLEDAEQQLDLFEKELEQLLAAYQKQVKKLHAARKKVATRLAKKITSAMQSLGLQGGSFEVQLEDKPELTQIDFGAEKVRFLVSTNLGQPAAPLVKIASGGELSRISLAIQVVAAKDTSIPTMLFDEVDSGVGGAVAETVGQQLKALSSQHQVLCVTPLTTSRHPGASTLKSQQVRQ